MDTLRYPTVYMLVKPIYTVRMPISQPLQSTQPALPAGKRRLITAAFKLAAQGASLSSLGIRELAREAELNHNTFYRHFADMEDLARSATEDLVTHLMDGFRQIRAQAGRHADATEGAARYLLEEAAKNPDAFRVGLRELHCGPPAIRKLMRDMIRQFAARSVEQIQQRNLVPGLEPDALRTSAEAITYYMFCRAVDYLDAPQQAASIRRDVVRYVRTQFLGALALQNQERKTSQQKIRRRS